MNSDTPAAAHEVNPQRLMGMAFGYAPALMLEAAVRHRVFDALDAGPKTLAELAAATGASNRGLRALLNALVGLELLSKQHDTGGDDDRYALTPESAAFLVSGKPAFLGGMMLHTSGQLLPKWLELSEIVRTGRPARAVNEEGEGSKFFEQFVEALFPVGYPGAQALAQSLGVASATGPVEVLDLAAGSGVWSIALAQASAHVRVTAIDWPGVLTVTRRVAERCGVAERCRFLPGDVASADFGSGYAVATLGQILHSEGTERSRALLAKTFHALAPGGTIAIAEWLVNEERTGPPHALIFAVNMLVNTEHGDTFSFGEIKAWLEAAGFQNARTLEAPGPSPLILATKPQG